MGRDGNELCTPAKGTQDGPDPAFQFPVLSEVAGLPKPWQGVAGPRAQPVQQPRRAPPPAPAPRPAPPRQTPPASQSPPGPPPQVQAGSGSTTSLPSHFKPGVAQSMDALAMMLSRHSQQCATGYRSRTPRSSVVVKIPWAEPEDLAPDFIQQMQSALNDTSKTSMLMVGATVRRGCIELVVDFIVLDTLPNPGARHLERPPSPPVRAPPSPAFPSSPPR
ncbi:hypothetical protein V8C86DRAFT_1705653 [Haematococcus lacustris]